ncbi:unnamed protein product [Closterium sp. Yama58-4]|nr:unnamed protein product [Closterium sp. Yama58-4]
MIPEGIAAAQSGPTSLPQLQLLRALAAAQIANAAVSAAPQASLSSRGSKRSAKDDSKPLRPRKRGRPSYKDRAAAALAAEEAAKAAKAAALVERDMVLRQIAAQMAPQMSPQGALMLLQQQMALQQIGMLGANQIGGFPAGLCAAPPALAHVRAGNNGVTATGAMDAVRQAMPAAADKIADRVASGAVSRHCTSDVDFAGLDGSAWDQSRLFAVTAKETQRQRTEDADTHQNTDGHSGDENESDFNGDASSWPRRGGKQTKSAVNLTHESSPKPLVRAGGSSVTEDGTQAVAAAAQAATNHAAPSGIFLAPPPSKSAAGPGAMPALDWMFSKDTRFVQPAPKEDLEEHADEHARKSRMGEAKEGASVPAHLVPTSEVKEELKAQDQLDLSLHL